MERMKRWFFWGLSIMVLSVPASSGAQEQASAIDPKADRLLRQMSDYMNTLQQFTFHIESGNDTLLKSGQKLQLSRSLDIFVRRPDRLRVNIKSDDRDQELYYNGKTITLFGKKINCYAKMDAPSNIEAAMDHASQSCRLETPGVELIYKNSFEILTEDVVSGFYAGLSTVLGVECHHLAFRGDDVDWQIWIENSKTPRPRKFIITNKWVTGSPQFIAFLAKWNASPQLADTQFIFKPPKDAQKIEFLPSQD